MKFKIISWNVNGIRSIYLKNFLDNVNILKPEILALQEVKCNDLEIVNKIFLELGYVFELRTAQKSGYSGVLIAYRKSLPYEVEFPTFADLLGKNILDKTFFDEGRFLIIKLAKFYLINVYVPSGSSSEERQIVKYRLMDNLTSWIDGLSSEIVDNLIICGDINICHQEIDIHHPKQATLKELSGFLPKEREWFREILTRHFKDVFRELNPEKREYTWWSYRAGARGKNLGWRLDYFLSGKNIFSSITSVTQHTDILGSDHCPVEIELEVK